MAAKRKSAKRAVKRRVPRRKPAVKKARARKAKRPARAAKAAAKAPRKAMKKAAPGKKAGPAAVPVTAFSLELVQVAPLRYEAAAALGRLETVVLMAGASEEGARVETLVFAPSGNAVQSSGEYVHRGQWHGERLLTDKGHLLDVDGACFCRDCEAAGGYTLDDDE